MNFIYIIYANLSTLFWLFINPALSIETSTLKYFYTDHSVQQSIASKALHQDEQKELQEEILHVLGLDHKPRSRRHGIDESAPIYLMDLYTSLNNDATVHHHKNRNEFGPNSSDMTESDTIISFVNKIKTQRNNKHLKHNRDKRFWFNITNVPKDSEIINAELRLYRDLKKSRFNSSYEFQMTIFQLFYVSNREQVVMNYVDSIKLKGNDNGWLKFNVTESVSEWIRFPNQNLGLFLQIRSRDFAKDLSPKSIGLVNSRGFKKYQPFMTVYIKSNGNNLREPSSRLNMFHRNRARRAVFNRKRSDGSYYDPDDRNPFLSTINRYGVVNKSCQKSTLFVSFHDLKWQDWIIVPEGYSAFFCEGDCSFPMDSHMNATNHAVVQHLMHIMHRHIPKPCCAPSELSSIMVLYFDDNSNAVLKKFKNMVINSCGCH